MKALREVGEFFLWMTAGLGSVGLVVTLLAMLWKFLGIK